MEAPVLKPGGFWICPTCGLRNKVWAPCGTCGTVVPRMAYPEGRLADAAPSRAGPRQSWMLYALIAAGAVTAIFLGVLLSRVLGSAALDWQDELPGAGRRAAATPVPPPAPPAMVPTPVPARPVPPPDVLPATPPAAVYTPSLSAVSPPPQSERPRLVITGGRAGADLRARQEAVRAARARFARAEAEVEAAEGGDPEQETAAMERLERAARDLRQAEAALDRARRRR